jgi:hypothetical protein
MVIGCAGQWRGRPGLCRAEKHFAFRHKAALHGGGWRCAYPPCKCWHKMDATAEIVAYDGEARATIEWGLLLQAAGKQQMKRGSI